MSLIIDANVHPTPDGRWFKSSYDASLECLLREMDKAGVARSLLVPFDGIIPNAFMAEAAAANPDRFLAGASFNPARCVTPAEVKVHFERELGDSPARVIKLHNRLHNYSLSDPRVEALLEANARRDRPFVVFICGYTYGAVVTESEHPVQVFHRFAILFPDTTFVIMHLGGSWMMQLYEAVRVRPNVYMDLSFAITKYKDTSFEKDITYLCRHFYDRLIFASDFPEISPVQALEDLRRYTAGLPDEKMNAILSGNVMRLLAAP